MAKLYLETLGNRALYTFTKERERGTKVGGEICELCDYLNRFRSGRLFNRCKEVKYIRPCPQYCSL